MVVRTSIKFCRPDPRFAYEKAYMLSYLAPSEIEKSNLNYDSVDVDIHDIRTVKNSLRLDREGFQIINLESKLEYEDFFQQDRVQAVFAEELRNTLKNVLGASGVFFHETVIRQRHPQFPLEPGAEKQLRYEQPIPKAHIDYSVEQLRLLIQEITGTPVPENVRVQAINVWKPLKGPLRDWPLAVCDARTLTRPTDLEPVDSVFPHGVVEGYMIHHNPKQKWCYISEQQPSELWVFNTADTGSVPPVAHCAFMNPDSKATDELRESIEFRVFLTYH